MKMVAGTWTHVGGLGILWVRVWVKIAMGYLCHTLAGSAEKTGGQWNDQEINLLLNYVRQNCTLMTSRDTNLKKSDFNKAHDMVKSKDTAQCHYKWGHVSTLTLKNYSDYLLNVVAM